MISTALATATQIVLEHADMSTAFLSRYPLNEQFEIYFRAVNVPDILATFVIGILVSWAREVYHIYYKQDESFSFTRALLTPLIGMTGALMGGEIANLSGREESSWLFVVAISWIGGQALDRFANLTIGLIDKALSFIGIRQEQTDKHVQNMDALRFSKEEKDLQEALNQPL